MKVGVLGTGNVGKALGTGFIGLGDQVKMGSRDPRHAQEWVEAHGAPASAGTFAEAAAFGELCVLAVMGSAVETVLQMAGAEHFAGKVVIDATNALDFTPGKPPSLLISGADSLGERVQRALTEGRVVKAFNSVGFALMVNPLLTGGPPDMFICGNDEAAKLTVKGILQSFGWLTIDIGGIEGARFLEAMTMVWVLSAMRANNWQQAFKMLRG